MVLTPEPCCTPSVQLPSEKGRVVVLPEPPPTAAAATPTSRSGNVARTTAPLVIRFIADLLSPRRAARGDWSQRGDGVLQQSGRRLASRLQASGSIREAMRSFRNPSGGEYGPPMQFQILGSIEVREDDRRISLGGPKQRLVLAHLLLRANQVVPADTLIEEIWGDEPPDAVRNALQAYVSRLRKALGPGRLEGRPPGYVLHAEPDEVDAVRFEALVRRARERAGRDANAAAALLDEGLALWKGAPLAGLADEPSLRPEVARLEELRLVAR